MEEKRKKIIDNIIESVVDLRRNSKNLITRFTFKFQRNKIEYRFTLRDYEFECDTYDSNTFYTCPDTSYKYTIKIEDKIEYFRKQLKLHNNIRWSFYYYQTTKDEFYINPYLNILTDADLEKLLIKIQMYVIKKF